MPAPATIAEFLDLARKSGVLDEKRLEAHVEKLRQANTLPPNPGQLAGVLVRDGLLTMFQAEQLVQGKWRRFTIGKYKVLERLGAGGMGSVYLCEHILMRRRVAVKILPGNKADDPASLERFYREARAVAALDHPNIVQAFDVGEADKLHFLVMEHVDGSSLQDIVKKTGPMDVLRACHYIRQSALGLQHAHERANLVHRDIKPGNILVDRNGIVKVLDMGLARFFNDEEDALTRKYDENVLGTADYLAPEQAEDSHLVDIRGDIYSLGGTFYYCLTGLPPFPEGTVAQKLIWHQTRQPKPVTAFRDDVPDGVVAVLNRMMAKSREQRYQTPLEVAEALTPFTQTPIPPPPDREMPQLSPAAMAPSVTGAADSGAPSSGTRKSWQVSGSGSAASKPATPAPATKPSSSRPVTAPTAPAPVPATQPMAVLAPPRPASAPRKPATPLPAPQVAVVKPPPAPPPPPSTPPRAPGTPLLQAAPPPPAPAPAGIATEPQVEEGEIGWEKLAPDTDDVTSHLDTARPSQRRRATRGLPINQENEAAQARRRLWMLIGGIGGVFLIGVALVVGLILGRGDPTQSSRPTQVGTEPQNQTLEVGPTAKFRTVSEALTQARDGDHIVVRGPELVDQLLPRNKFPKNLTIEGADGQVVWKRTPGVKGYPEIAYLYNVEGLTIKGFILDGGGTVEHLVTLTGPIPGVTLQQLILRNYTRGGVRLWSAEGRPDNPITLTQLRVDNATAPPVLFDLSPLNKINNHIRIQDCTFKGPQAFVGVRGQSLGNDVALSGNIDKRPVP